MSKENNESVNYLPLGSIVIVKGGVKKYMIIARALQVKINGQDHFFDYGACTYPEGVVSDQLVYFQHSNIDVVVSEGYSDEDDRLMIKNIHETYKEKGVEHTDIRKLKGELEA